MLQLRIKEPLDLPEQFQPTDEIGTLMAASILEAYDEYQAIPIEVPIGEAGEQTTDVVFVAPVYYMVTKKKRAAREALLSVALAAAAEANPVVEDPDRPSQVQRGEGLFEPIIRGKARPEELKMFIEAAVAESAGGTPQVAVGKRTNLPDAATDTAGWEESLAKWIKTTPIGIDCTMFVNDAVRRFHWSYTGEDAWAGAEPRQRVVRRSQDVRVRRPSRLRPGDIDRYKPKTGVGHARVVLGVAASDEGWEVITVDASGSADGIERKRWRFPKDNFRERHVNRSGEWIRDDTMADSGYFRKADLPKP